MAALGGDIMFMKRLIEDYCCPVKNAQVVNCSLILNMLEDVYNMRLSIHTLLTINIRYIPV